MSEILTPDEWRTTFQSIVVTRTNTEVERRFRLVAHDEALRSQLAAKDAEIERRRGLIHDMTNALRRANEKNDAAEARVKKLMEYIRVAPHGGMCASIEHLNSYYADHPRPLCDCWKAAALEEIEGVKK